MFLDNYFLLPVLIPVADHSIGENLGISKEQFNLVGDTKELVEPFLTLFRS